MPDNMPSLQRRISLLKGWFVPLDEEKRNPLKSGRLRLLLLFVALLLLLLLVLATPIPCFSWIENKSSRLIPIVD